MLNSKSMAPPSSPLCFPCSKMFDIELCPLPFSMEEMFGFISCRFSGYPASVQEQALLWLHVSIRPVAFYEDPFHIVWLK